MKKRKWTRADVDELLRMKKGGMSDQEIAVKTGRSFSSINNRVSKLKSDGEWTYTRLSPSTFPVWDKPLTSQGDALILSDVEAPFQHSDFINRCIDLADAWGIKDLHLAGDLLHYDNLSAWGSEWIESKEDLVEEVLDRIFEALKAKQEGREQARQVLEDAGYLSQSSLSSELAEARGVFRSITSFDNIYIALGNHDDRYLRAIERALEPKELLVQLDRHNDKRWKIAPYYYTLIETDKGTFRATHPRGAGRLAAIDLAIQYHQNIVMGHSHRWAVNRDPSGKFWAIQTGHCVDENRLAYVRQRDAKRDAHMLGATILRGGFPFVLCEDTPWDIMRRM